MLRRVAAWTAYVAVLAAMATGIVWLIMHNSPGHAIFVTIFALLFLFLAAPAAAPDRL